MSADQSEAHVVVDSSSDEAFKVPSLPLKAAAVAQPSDAKKSRDGDVHSATDSRVIPEPLTDKLPTEGLYSLEIMKNGSIVQKISLNKNRVVFGRARDCDVQMEHPSLSRYHAAILYKESSQDPSKGFFYLMDLHSTHGTMLNKDKINPGACLKLAPNNSLIKLGGSSRLIMVTSLDESDEQSEVSSTQAETSSTVQGDVCSWGMREYEADDDAEDAEAVNLHSKLAAAAATLNNAQTANHQAYCENSQKVLSQWFEREGFDFEYNVNFSNNKFVCTIKLPTEAQDYVITGEPQVRKKEAIADACMMACKLLDKAEQLFPWQQAQTAKRKVRLTL